MNKTLLLLIQLQNLILGNDGDLSAVSGRIECLRSYLPETYLSKFDRLLRRRRLAVAALTDSGTCGNCCSSLPIGDSIAIRRERNVVHACRQCGCFLCSDIRPLRFSTQEGAGL